MTNDETVLSPEEAARRWTYSDDGLQAHRMLDNVTITLHGQRDPEPRPSGEWLPTLLFTLSSYSFACEFEIERQVYRVGAGHRPGEYPYIFWRVNYPAMQVSVDSGALAPVSSLDLMQWLDFDMMFLGVLESWPRPADEEALPDHEDKYHRFIYLEGGWLGGEWAEDFVRAVPNFSSRVETRNADLRQVPVAEIPEPARNWRYIADEHPSIVNARTGVRLTYDALRISEISILGRGKPYHYFRLEDGKRQFIFRTSVAASNGDGVLWWVDLRACVLLTNGWSASEVDNPEIREKLYSDSDRLAPNPVELANMVQTIGDGLVHWPRLDVFWPRDDACTETPPTTIKFHGFTENGRFWPFVSLTVGRQSDMFNLFENHNADRRRMSKKWHLDLT